MKSNLLLILLFCISIVLAFQLGRMSTPGRVHYFTTETYISGGEPNFEYYSRANDALEEFLENIKEKYGAEELTVTLEPTPLGCVTTYYMKEEDSFSYTTDNDSLPDGLYAEINDFLNRAEFIGSDNLKQDASGQHRERVAPELHVEENEPTMTPRKALDPLPTFWP